MKKGTLVAVAAVLAIASAAAAWWWLRHDRASGEDIASPDDVPAVLTPALRQARAERVRASVEHRRRLWRETTYIDVRQAAMNGDAVAQRRLSEIYEDCLAYAGSLRVSLRMLGTLSKAELSSQSTVEGIYTDYKQFCVQADADLRKNPGAGSYWLHRSAKAGDLASEMRFFGRSVTALSSAQLKHFVDRLRLSGDPDAIFEMSLLLAKANEPWPDAALAPAFKGERAQSAWMLAACRAGYDCAQGSRVLDMICVTLLACSLKDYQGYLRLNNGSAEQQAELDRLVTLIERDVLQMQPTR